MNVAYNSPFDEKCLEASDLLCIRDERVLFEDLSFSVTNGQTLILEGKNGSGKTSLLRILSGIRLQDSGDVFWNGKPIGNNGVEYHSQLTYVGHLDGIKLDLTVMENLQCAQSLGNFSDCPIADALKQVDLEGLEELATRILSAGQRRRLALSRLLVSASSLWILDEPFTALDKDGINLFEKLMTNHTDRGGMIVMTSHHDLCSTGEGVRRMTLSP